ncbi:MAG: acyl-CoA synthetase [Algoriphagus sp.]|nr:acyl-CoA synthetase [Algoriphagus sp.]
MLQIVENAKNYLGKTAIVDSKVEYTFSELLQRSEAVSASLLEENADLNQKRVAYIISPGFEYAAIQLGIWRAGGIAVPLCITYPFPSLKYVIEDTGAEYLIVGPEYEELLSPYKQTSSIKFITLAEINPEGTVNLPEIDKSRGAMILYTSGTTNLPKGVLTTHANIEAQIYTLVKAWHWSSNDYTIGILPLHHVHGIINVLSCALWSGATIQFLHPFNADEVFEVFEEGKVTVFMAVPTIYFKLIAQFEVFPEERQRKLTPIMEKFRLMVSGSAALPVSVMAKWKEISGHYLLERYGMTEIGMAISNPYHHDRKAGYIGQALDGVEIRLVNEENQVVLPGHAGEIQVKGPSVFKEYWGKPEATANTFTEDGWFKTGDIAVIEAGYFRILGRDSIDIIKSGGYKISALEIEEVIRQYPGVKDVGVVGIPDEEWGEIVVSALVLENPIDTKVLNSWLRERMPAYKTPRSYKIIEELPRNAMGKVTKNDLKKLF